METKVIRALALVGCLMFSATVMAAEKIKIPSEVTLFKNMNIFDGETDKLQ